MWRAHLLARLPHARGWATALAIGLAIAPLAADPTPLLPIARGYRALCERYPSLTLLTLHAPPLPLALLLILAGLAVLAGIAAGSIAMLRTHRFNQRLRRAATPLPPRVVRVAAGLGLADHISYLAWPEPAACCYGFLRPRIAITAGLVLQLDDEELTAALAHERQHLRRRDPMRYLLLHTLTAAAFMFPVAPALRRRQEARIELAADRAALVVAPRAALAGALLAALNASPIPVPGVVGLTATEARIAQLGGRAMLPEIPAPLLLLTLGLAVIIASTTMHLAASAHLVTMGCALCTGTS